MQIRKLKESDLENVILIEKMIFGYIAENEEVILSRIKTFNQGCLGVFKKNKLIGYCSSEIWNKYNKIELNVEAEKNHNANGTILYITSLAVLKEFQNKKIGTKLLKNLVNLAKKLNLKSIYLRTSKAEKFYEKNGFKKIRRVYPNTKKQYDIMELTLN